MFYSRFATVALILSCFSSNTLAVEKEERYYESALESMSLDDIDSAYIHLKNALAENGNHVPSKILMGKLLYAKGFFNPALEELYEAEQLGADSNLTAVSIARSLLVLKSYDRILNIDTSLFKKDVAFEIYLIQSSAQQQSASPKKAIEFLNKANKIQPNSLRMLQSYASHYLYIGEFDKAKKYIQMALEMYDETAQTLHLQGQLAYRHKKIPLAISLFEKAHELSESNPIIMRSLSSTYMENGDYAKALDIAQRVVNKTPGDPYAKLLLGQLRARNNQSELAKQVFDELLASLTLLPEEIMQSSDELQFVNAFASYLNQDYEVAAKALSSYLSINSNSMKALALLADTYIKLETPKEALTLLDRRQNMVVSNIPLSVTLCNLYIENNRSFKCDKVLQQAEAIHGKQATFDFVRIQSLMERQRFNDALMIFERTFSEAEDETLILLGIQLKMQTTAYTDALSDINDLYKHSPDITKVKLIEAQALLKSGRAVEAKLLTESVVNSNSFHREGLVLHAEILLELGEYSEALTIARDLYEVDASISYSVLLAEALFKAGTPNEAVTVLEDARAVNQGNIAISGLLLDIYLQSEELQKALTEVDNLLKANRLDQKALVAKANILSQLGQFEKAQSALNILYGMWNDNPRLLVRLSQMQISAGDLKGAEKSLSEAENLAPESITIALEKAKLQLKSDQLNGLEKNIKALQLRAPNSADVHILAGNYYKAINEKELAFDAYTQAFKLNPQSSINAAYLYKSALSKSMRSKFENLVSSFIQNNDNAYFHKRLLADFYVAEKAYDKARPLYEELVNVENLFDKATVFNNLASIEASKDLEKAVSYAKEARRISPNSPQILDTYGWLLAQQGNYEEALPFLRKAYSFNAVDPNIMYHLGAVLAKQGKNTQAKIELSNALASDTPFDSRIEAKRLLESL